MMSDDVIDPDETDVLELAKRLEAYADARLSPSAASTTEVRRNVMNVAHRRAALVTAEAADATTVDVAATQAKAASSAWRRPAVAILAGFLTIAIVATASFGTKPGGMLYDARIWTEMTNLPADVVARAKAQINRLDARLDEAQLASTAGDSPGVRAALAAYSVIVIEAAVGSRGDPTAIATIQITVSRHVIVLTSMVDNVPPPARDAVQQALSSSAMALEDLDNVVKQESRDRPIDANVTNATAPDRTKPVRPTRVVRLSPVGAAVTTVPADAVGT